MQLHLINKFMSIKIYFTRIKVIIVLIKYCRFIFNTYIRKNITFRRVIHVLIDVIYA